MATDSEETTEPGSAMTPELARQRLKLGAKKLTDALPAIRKRERYLIGEQDRPYAPDGTNNDEYNDLLKMSIANFYEVAVIAPIQRLRLEAIRTGLNAPASPEQAAEDDAEELEPDAGSEIVDVVDGQIWEAWQFNKLDTRQSIVYESMVQHGRGLFSCWPNPDDVMHPIVRPESLEHVHIEMDPEDPFTPLYAVKIYRIEEPSPAGTRVKEIGIVYDAEGMERFERNGVNGGNWRYVTSGHHGLGRVPFALYDYRPDAKGQPRSRMDGLIRQQDAINTIRFNTLLAMQFAAYRQKIITGFDPRLVDKDGNVVYRKDENGDPILDPNGQPIPEMVPMARFSVDRMMAFPGQETKVTELGETDLTNYVETLQAFLIQFFSSGQVPPQYMIGQMANLSGEALTAAESTLASLVQELQLAAGEGHEALAWLIYRAQGGTDDIPPTAESDWKDAEARSFSQVIDAIVKLINVEFPKEAAWAMIPGATRTRLKRWLEMADMEDFAAQLDASRQELQAELPPVIDEPAEQFA